MNYIMTLIILNVIKLPFVCLEIVSIELKFIFTHVSQAYVVTSNLLCIEILLSYSLSLCNHISLNLPISIRLIFSTTTANNNDDDDDQKYAPKYTTYNYASRRRHRSSRTISTISTISAITIIACITSRAITWRRICTKRTSTATATATATTTSATTTTSFLRMNKCKKNNERNKQVKLFHNNKNIIFEIDKNIHFSASLFIALKIKS